MLVSCITQQLAHAIASVSYQLTGQKAFRLLKYLIERTVCSIQQVYYIE